MDRERHNQGHGSISRTGYTGRENRKNAETLSGLRRPSPEQTGGQAYDADRRTGTNTFSQRRPAGGKAIRSGSGVESVRSAHAQQIRPPKRNELNPVRSQRTPSADTRTRPVRPAQGRAAAQQRRLNGVDIMPGRPTESPGRKAVNKKKSAPLRNRILMIALVLLIITVAAIIAAQSCSSGKSASAKPQVSAALPDTAPVAANADESAGGQKNGKMKYAKYTDTTGTLTIDSEYGILIDIDTNTVLASKKGDNRIYPASMTKVMTLIVAYETLGDMDKEFKFTQDIIDPLYEAGASVAGFQAGETVKIRDLIYGAALPSGADATGALAVACAGSEEAFAGLMNAKVQELGLEHTHFVNASGLHNNDHYSTCHDIAKIMEYAISIPFLRSAMGTYRYTTSATEQHPDGIELTSTMYRNMVGDEAKGLYIQGGKTGYTAEARHCLASFAAKCTEAESGDTPPRYILVTAFAWERYKSVFDAINAYAQFCGTGETSLK